MGKFNLRLFALSFICGFSLNSCSNDSSGESNGTTTGDYFPSAVNNKWNYMDTSPNASEIELIGTTTFGNTTYYEMTDTFNPISNQNWIGKRGASYFQKTGPITQIQAGNTIVAEGYELKILQDDMPVGESWHGTASPKVTYTGPSGSGSFRAQVTYSGTITSRGGSVEFNSVTYENVIKVQLESTINSNGQINNVTGEYWFAKDVGIIYDSSFSTVDGVTKTRYLTSYELH